MHVLDRPRDTPARAKKNAIRITTNPSSCISPSLQSPTSHVSATLDASGWAPIGRRFSIFENFLHFFFLPPFRFRFPASSLFTASWQAPTPRTSQTARARCPRTSPGTVSTWGSRRSGSGPTSTSMSRARTRSPHVSKGSRHRCSPAHRLELTRVGPGAASLIFTRAPPNATRPLQRTFGSLARASLRPPSLPRRLSEWRAARHPQDGVHLWE